MLLHQTSLSLIFLISIFSKHYLKLTEHELPWQKLDQRKDTCTHGILEKRRISAVEKPTCIADSLSVVYSGEYKWNTTS